MLTTCHAVCMTSWRLLLLTDFTELSEMTRYLSNSDPSVADARKSLRALTAPDTSMRIAIALQ